MGYARRVRFLCIPLLGVGCFSWSQSVSISYKVKCEMCHGAAGLADTQQAKLLKVLPFTDPTVVSKSDTTLTGIIENGTGKMPAFKGKLTDNEITNLIRYVRQVQNNQP